jgi:hypothetical protein
VAGFKLQLIHAHQPAKRSSLSSTRSTSALTPAARAAAKTSLGFVECEMSRSPRSAIH